MSYLELQVKDLNTPLTPTEWNYLVDKLNARKLRNLIDVQDSDPVDKNILQHNGSGWVYYDINKDYYTKTQINNLLGIGDDGGGGNSTFYVTDGDSIAAISTDEMLQISGDGVTLDVNGKSFTISSISSWTELSDTPNSYVGSEDYEVVVGASGQGLEYKPPTIHTFVYEQSTPSTIWSITHPMSKYPSVTVVDSAGTRVEGSVTYTDLNNLTITFNAGFSGTATLN